MRFIMTRLRLIVAVAAIVVFSSLHAPSSVESRPLSSTTDVQRRIRQLIERAIAARDRASESIRSAYGAGRYEVSVTDADKTVRYTERAKFRMAFDQSKNFIQFRYEPNAGFGRAYGKGSDVYARVVLTDGKRVYQSQLCDRISLGAEGRYSDDMRIERGSLAPFADVTGDLATYYAFIDLLTDDYQKLSLRENDGLQVITGIHSGGKAASEFSIDPAKGFQIVRYRLWNFTGEDTFAAITVVRDWQRIEGSWYVKRCVSKQNFHRDGRVDRTEKVDIEFKSFKPNAAIPADVFSIHALGLPNGARILPTAANKPIERYAVDQAFPMSEVEKVVGELPKTRKPPTP